MTLREDASRARGAAERGAFGDVHAFATSAVTALADQRLRAQACGDVRIVLDEVVDLVEQAAALGADAGAVTRLGGALDEARRHTRALDGAVSAPQEGVEARLAEVAELAGGLAAGTSADPEADGAEVIALLEEIETGDVALLVGVDGGVA